MTHGNWNALGYNYMYMLVAVPLFFCNVLPEYFQSTSRVLPEYFQSREDNLTMTCVKFDSQRGERSNIRYHGW